MSNFLATIKGSSIANLIRTITATVFGPEDAKSAPEIGPAGYDAAPLPGLTAVYIKTAKKDGYVFIGYAPVNQLANPGEARMYSTDADGAEQARVWCHNDGTVEVAGTGNAGSNTNHATQWEALNAKIVAYFTAQNAAITTSIEGLSGAYTPPTPIDLSTAKATKILIP